jgi:cell division protein FtsZ
MKTVVPEMFELVDGHSKRAVIRVIGVGGGGCNTVNQMAQAGIEGVEFICANTDRVHLEKCAPTLQLQMGVELTRGLGAGSDPEVGAAAAEEDRERIAEMLEGTDLLFVTAGMGGGTGTGAAPVIAEIAKEMKILTVAVVTKPFASEKGQRMTRALHGIVKLSQQVDSLIVIPNDKLRLVLGGSISLKNAFKAANDVLQNAVLGISDLITRPGEMNLDFADVRTVMSSRGTAMMGIGRASGEDRAKRSVEMALSSPLLDDIEVRGARGILVNITCDDTLTLDEYEFINSHVGEIASEDADFKCGTSFDPNLNGEIRVTVVATGLESQRIVQPVTETLPNRLRGPSLGHAAGNVTPMRQPLKSARPQDVEIPTLMRSNSRPSGGGLAALADYNEELLDIPAFLRAQAD